MRWFFITNQKNMVQSINHWALASDFIEDSNNTYKATSIADLLFGNNGLDTYQETIATSWLIHWKLAGEARKTTTWYWLFNKLTNPILEKEFLIKNLFSFAEKLQSKTSLTTLRRDLDCRLRSYVPSEGNVTPEELSESVLGDLGILRQISRGKYEFVRGEKDSLPQGIFIYALLKVSPKFFSALIKVFLYTIIFNNNKKKIYFQRLSGLFNSIIGNKSWYRPNI